MISFYNAPKAAVDKEIQLTLTDKSFAGITGKIIIAWAIGESGMGGNIIRTDIYYHDEQAAKLSAPSGCDHNCTSPFWCSVIVLVTESNGDGYMIVGGLHKTSFGGNITDILRNKAISKLNADERKALGISEK